MIKQQLKELRLREKELVESIRDEIKKRDSSCEIVYMPNRMPKEKVRYIFVAMEPSFGHWAKDEKDAEEKIRNGFRNFIFSWEDFIFHYCITKYLSPSYFVTDISKAAMKVKDANRWRNKIYPKWIELLKEEIEIVGQNDCKLIFVGKSVGKFLEPKKLNRNVLKTVLHYSGQAGKQRKKMPQKYPKDFKNFKKNLSSDVILDFAENFLKQNSIPTQVIEWVLRKLKNSKTKLSESRKELMFTYYREFQENSQID